MKWRAVCLIRTDLAYRRQAFMSGLEAAGCQILTDYQGAVTPRDILVIWNRYDSFADAAKVFERGGGAAIIAENGFAGHRYTEYAKPMTAAGDQLYALAIGYHNGAGKWPTGEPGGWRRHGIEPQPWRQGGDYILVLPQRGIGPNGVRMPDGWIDETVRRLEHLTTREIRLRAHPGNNPATVPLEDDLDGAWATVTWGSGAAIRGLIYGVPCFHTMPSWIGAPAALPLEGADLEDPLRDDTLRERMLDRLAWAQWSDREISSGEPFRRLLAIHQETVLDA
jgi:hypothetical protein